MKKCSYCGYETKDEDIRVCPDCGSKKFEHVLDKEEIEAARNEAKVISKEEQQNALVSLVLGVIGLALDFGVIGIVFNILAMSIGKKTKDKHIYGKIGYFLGLAGTILFIAVVIFYVFYSVLISFGVVTSVTRSTTTA